MKNTLYIHGTTMTTKNETSLKSIVNELLSEKQTVRTLNKTTKKAVSLDETAIDSLLNSDVFSVRESKALKMLFSKTKTKSLTEATIKRLDTQVKIISELRDGHVKLSEGFFGDMWSGLKSLGDKAKEAVVGGWSKMKAIWSEFKELVQEVINSAKNGLLTLCNKAANVGNVGAEFMGKVKDKKLTADPDVIKELKQLGETGSWWKSAWFQKWVVNPFWEKDVLAGKGTVDQEPKVDPKAAEQGLQAIPALESLISKRNNLLSDYGVVSELLNRSERKANLKESHAVEHLDDAIKNPALKKVVHYAIELIQWVFMPFAKLGQVVAKAVAPKLLGAFSNVTKSVGGPGAYAFELLGTIFGEFVEVAIKKIMGEDQKKMVAAVLFPGISLGLDIVSGIHYALLCWTCANIVINLVDVVNKEKTESYSPIGEFKMQNGNLLFIKE